MKIGQLQKQIEGMCKRMGAHTDKEESQEEMLGMRAHTHPVSDNAWDEVSSWAAMP
jgi:hypothetical protein